MPLIVNKTQLIKIITLLKNKIILNVELLLPCIAPYKISEKRKYFYTCLITLSFLVGPLTQPSFTC